MSQTQATSALQCRYRLLNFPFCTIFRGDVWSSHFFESFRCNLVPSATHKKRWGRSCFDEATAKSNYTNSKIFFVAISLLSFHLRALSFSGGMKKFCGRFVLIICKSWCSQCDTTEVHILRPNERRYDLFVDF